MSVAKAVGDNDVNKWTKYLTTGRQASKECKVESGQQPNAQSGTDGQSIRIDNECVGYKWAASTSPEECWMSRC